MPKNENDYSDYVQYYSNLSNVLSLLCGFTFTSTTVLLSLLSDPSQLLAQITLFVLGFCTNLFLLLIGWIQMQVVYFLKKPQQLPTKRERKASSTFNLLVFLSTSLLGLAGFFMYLVFNLVYLALAVMIAQILFIILGYTFVWRAFVRHVRETYSQFPDG